MGRSLETITWVAALLAATRTIRVYSTVHVPVFHPLVAAKMGATLDHIGNGRWGINIVSGWNAHDFDMMGVELLPHANRYARAADFIAILKGLWTEEPGTFDNFTKEMFVIGGVALPIVGTPEQVAERLAQLYRSGVDAVLMIFLSFYDDTVRFGRDIVPLLRQMDVVE